MQLQKISEAGYNPGARDFASAPLLSPLPATVKARVQRFDDGQYFRVRVAAGGTLQLTGTATKVYCYQAYFQVLLYDTPTSTPFTFFGTTVSPGFGVCGTKTFTSRTYTNTSGAAKEVYLRLLTQWDSIEDLVFQVNGGEGPRLTLFMDANSDFNPASPAPASDDATYLPGADFATGVSVALPQHLQMIAAYTNASGAIVAPPSYAPSSVTMERVDTSSLLGFATNAGSDTGPDFALAGSSASFGLDHTARIALDCLDYGGRTSIKASDGQATAILRLPKDVDENGLPDVGWPTGDGVSPDSGLGSDDLDSAASPVLGDGLTAFEEYRGFMVMGVHTRTHSDMLDLFVDSPFGVGDAPALPLTVHEIAEPEVGPEREINTSSFENGSPLAGRNVQRAIQIREGYYLQGAGGESMRINSFPVGPGGSTLPWNSAWVRIYSQSLRELSPFSSDRFTPDDIDTAKFMQTVAHEIGHNIFSATSTRVARMTHRRRVARLALGRRCGRS